MHLNVVKRTCTWLVSTAMDSNITTVVGLQVVQNYYERTRSVLWVSRWSSTWQIWSGTFPRVYAETVHGLLYNAIIQDSMDCWTTPMQCDRVKCEQRYDWWCVCVTELSRDEVLALGSLLVICLHDWAAVCLSLVDRLQPHWSHDRYPYCDTAVSADSADHHTVFTSRKAGVPLCRKSWLKINIH